MDSQITWIIRRLYNLAAKWGLFTGPNPVAGVQMPKLNNQKTEYLTEEEFERLLAVIDAWPHKHTAGLVKFALFTGLRRGEVFKLKWDDVDFEHSLVTLKDPKGTITQTRLIRCCRVLSRRREQKANQGRQQGFASPAGIVNELEKAQIPRQILLRDSPMWAKPRAQE